MNVTPVYFKDGTPFALDYIRIVHGKRGSYMELSRELITCDLTPRFSQALPTELPSRDAFYYYWLVPAGREEKIYWQNRTVKYADYKVGMFYIDQNLVVFEAKNSLLKEC